MLTFIREKLADITIANMQILITANWYSINRNGAVYLDIPQIGAVEWFNDAPGFIDEAEKFLTQFEVPKRLQ